MTQAALESFCIALAAALLLFGMVVTVALMAGVGA